MAECGSWTGFSLAAIIQYHEFNYFEQPPDVSSVSIGGAEARVAHCWLGVGGWGVVGHSRLGSYVVSGQRCVHLTAFKGTLSSSETSLCQKQKTYKTKQTTPPPPPPNKHTRTHARTHAHTHARTHAGTQQQHQQQQQQQQQQQKPSFHQTGRQDRRKKLKSRV